MGTMCHPERSEGSALRRSRGTTCRSLAALGITLAALLLVSCTDPPPEIPPRQISASPFHYPEELWDAGVEGQTVLELHVSEEGTVDSAKVQTPSGYEAFDSAALAGAQALEFEPARRGDRNVAVRVLLPVQFNLPDTAAAAP